MAAEMAVESTAREEIQTEDRHQTVLEDRLAEVHQTVLEDHSERILREEATVTVRREGLTVRAETVQEELMARDPREGQQQATVQGDHASEKEPPAQTVRREGLTARVLREGHTAETVRREEATASVLKEEVMATAPSREDLQ